MKRALAALSIVVAIVLLAGGTIFVAIMPPDPLAVPAPGLVLSDVTLVEPGRSRAAHRRLVVVGEAVDSVADASPDPDDPFAGATVLPGLNDLHMHFPPPALPGQIELWSFLFLYHGVTGVRDAADVSGNATEPARRGVRERSFPGPRILACGPLVDGDPPLWDNSIVVRTPEDGRRAVEKIAAGDFDCVKAYNGLSEESLVAIRTTAWDHGLPVIGHVPRNVPFERARLDDAQHLMGVAGWQPDERPYPFNQTKWPISEERLDFVIEQSLRYELAHTPTLVVGERLAAFRSYDDLLLAPDAQLLPPLYREVVWNPDGGVTAAKGMGPGDFDVMDRALEAKLQVVKRMHDAGVRLHSGTDALVAFVVPGASLHRELQLFVRAGLTPEQALAISTDASAEFLGIPELGRLRSGAPAELLIFRDDPTVDLDALDTLLGVVRAGRLYTREQLDAQLERYRAHYDGALYRSVITPLVRRTIASTVGD